MSACFIKNRNHFMGAKPTKTGPKVLTMPCTRGIFLGKAFKKEESKINIIIKKLLHMPSIK